uniref:Phospholipid/glycerol acyltransferase domain-containing protein n=1 Tax=Macaca nemestrina TaxID=9545 RepID=A0A2K6B7E6_MACNE
QGAKEKQHQNIAKDPTSLEEDIKETHQSGSSKALDKTPHFQLSDIFYFCRKGMETIMDDEVTKKSSAEELESWNLLSRTHYNFRYITLQLIVLWGLGGLILYCLLLPLRIALDLTGISLLVVGTTVAGYLLHTSPIDVIILASDGYYATVGQVHGGHIGLIQRAMVKTYPHIRFECLEVKDRHLVAKRLTEEVQDKKGTCINNTSVMMFKKGSFEIGATVYPLAIKYDHQFGDAFWNRMMMYLRQMMTSWAIVCSVWYLPPMTREADEDAIQFANRVKSTIARQGELVDLLWDRGLKREKVKDMFKEEQQKLYSKMIVRNHKDRSRL